MAISKNKTEIIDKLSLKEIQEEIYYYNSYYWYDDDDDYDYDYDSELTESDDDYDYLGEEIYLEYISKGFKVKRVKYIIGSFIDMESAYSKSNLRKMRLEVILEGKRLPNEKVYLTDNLNKRSLDNLKKIY